MIQQNSTLKDHFYRNLSNNLLDNGSFVEFVLKITLVTAFFSALYRQHFEIAGNKFLGENIHKILIFNLLSKYFA